mmetsp:Transcript_2978/g.5892  ORF Transcript_2978/g.5892 Transcript_2978/m.5892 type:complete len:253 (-) Transcript_2978:293-1051(-)
MVDLDSLQKFLFLKDLLLLLLLVNLLLLASSDDIKESHGTPHLILSHGMHWQTHDKLLSLANLVVDEVESSLEEAKVEEDQDGQNVSDKEHLILPQGSLDSQLERPVDFQYHQVQSLQKVPIVAVDNEGCVCICLENLHPLRVESNVLIHGDVGVSLLPKAVAFLIRWHTVSSNDIRDRVLKRQNQAEKPVLSGAWPRGVGAVCGQVLLPFGRKVAGGIRRGGAPRTDLCVHDLVVIGTQHVHPLRYPPRPS